MIVNKLQITITVNPALMIFKYFNNGDSLTVMFEYFFLFKIEINKIKPVTVIIEDIIKNTLITKLKRV
jgi:hypothetical protein